jgi:hypothetical protein
MGIEDHLFEIKKQLKGETDKVEVENEWDWSARPICTFMSGFLKEGTGYT